MAGWGVRMRCFYRCAAWAVFESGTLDLSPQGIWDMLVWLDAPHACWVEACIKCYPVPVPHRLFSQNCSVEEARLRQGACLGLLCAHSVAILLRPAWAVWKLWQSHVSC